ncbi:DUF300-domain-containing protein [Lepidopterella palustris CBS 459.81]|uniref:DUF300-domain-containing protein n=1 Tax=Lepidopterella palustris CBS 459.81 TaxID=1314670 RepID=A0A8E2E8D8_9PEZI|nr:DUF300-domain-containing protein [Lepidopterella palustris CBS 459.81]
MKCNTTLTEEIIKEDPLWHNLTFHHFGLIISATFGLIALSIALFLILRHSMHYLKPWEQKHIIRILFMIPIYSTVSFLSYLYYRHAIYFEVLRDCYEAFAIASFFTLLCHYIASNLHDQKDYFRTLKPRSWVWPLSWVQKCTGGPDKGAFRTPQSGLTWFNIIWIGVFQYCFVRVFFTVLSVVTSLAGRYCEASLNPQFAHIWVMLFEGVSVTIAMYCLIQFYIQLRGDLAAHRPFLKILCIKLVIFFSFWQTLTISFLSSSNGPLKPSAKVAYPDIKVGFPSMLLCIEMAIFSIMHIFAFPWTPYDISRYQDPVNAPTGGFSGPIPTTYAGGPGRALAQAFNPWDIIKACGRGFRWLFVGVRRRKEDVSYQTKLGSLDSGAMGYPQGPTFAGNGEAATEILGEGLKKKSTAYKPLDDDDRAGLLSHAQANPYERQDISATNSSSDIASFEPDHLPAAALPPSYTGPGAERGRTPRFEPQDTSYHAPGAAQSVNPARRPQVQQQDLGERPSTEWDMFAGANPGDSKKGPPPGMI